MRLDQTPFIVLGVSWQVREVPCGDPRIDDLCGKADWSNYVIWLNSDLPYSERVETLIHECLHIITGGLDKADLTDESTLRLVSAILVDTLRRNEVSLLE